MPKPFYVYGVAIDEQAQAAMRSKMRAGPFTAADIEAAAIAAGVPEIAQGGVYVAHRAADRFIQRERTAGRIQFTRPNWTWVTPPA